MCAWERGRELTSPGFTVKCTVTADCSECPSVCLSAVSVSSLSLSPFISPSVSDLPLSTSDLSPLPTDLNVFSCDRCSVPPSVLFPLNKPLRVSSPYFLFFTQLAPLLTPVTLSPLSSRCSIDGVEDKRIIGMQIDSKSHTLWVAFTSCVVKVPLSRCERHGRCKK